MASCSLLITASAAKEIEDLEPKALRRRLVARIEALADDPRPPGCEKLARQDEQYRVRQGAWRIVYAIDDNQVVVMVVKAGQRKGVHEALTGSADAGAEIALV